MKRYILPILVVCAVVLSPVTGHSESFNIDMSNAYIGSPASSYGAAGSAGTWNAIADGVSKSLVNLSGESTGASVVVTAGNYAGIGGLCSPADLQALIRDCVYSEESTWSASFSGLSNGTYTLIIYAPNFGAIVPTGTLLVNGTEYSSIEGELDCTLTPNVTYRSVEVTISDGTLLITGTPSGTYAGVAGLQLSLNGTLIELLSFASRWAGSALSIEWETASEIDNAGFYLWRSETEDGQYTCINEALIPAEGGHTWGAEYEYEDFDVEPGLTYYYKLEDIDYSGVSTFHGPVSATPGDDAILLLSPEDGASVSPVTPLTFEWDGAGLIRFKLQFSTDPTFQKKVMVLPPDEKKQRVWIEDESYTPSPKEWRGISRLGRKGETVFWRVNGEDEAGEGHTSEAFELNIDN